MRCWSCKQRRATVHRWVNHSTRQLCDPCAERFDLARAAARAAKKPPKKPPCLPEAPTAHYWDCTPGENPLCVCRKCGAEYRFPPPAEWAALWTNPMAEVSG